MGLSVLLIRFIRVPRFHFDLTDAAGSTPDEEGAELPDWDSARDRAVRAARSIMAADVLGGYLDLGGRIEVTCASDGSKEIVSFQDVVDITTGDSPLS